jgi:hypothetical protein
LPLLVSSVKIVNDATIGASLTDVASSVNYDHNMIIIQATEFQG